MLLHLFIVLAAYNVVKYMCNQIFRNTKLYDKTELITESEHNMNEDNEVVCVYVSTI